MVKITKKLENMLARASKKLEEAQNARSEVMDYIEEHYGIDSREYYESMEDNMNWCYGIDSDKVKELIQKNKSAVS